MCCNCTETYLLQNGNVSAVASISNLTLLDVMLTRVADKHGSMSSSASSPCLQAVSFVPQSGQIRASSSSAVDTRRANWKR